MFKKSFAESDKLPPTKGALEQHIKRAHYQAMVWYNDEVAKPNIPNPTEYGWEINNNTYIPVITHMPPAIKGVLELVRCKCIKQQNGALQLQTQNVVCTEMCTCEGSDGVCENTE